MLKNGDQSGRSGRAKSWMRSRSLTAMVLAGAMSLCGMGLAQAHDSDHGSGDEGRPLFDEFPDNMLDPELFDKDRLSDEAQRAIEQLMRAAGPIVEQLSLMIDGLPRYEPPVILPNGDILIRRKHEGSSSDPADEESLDL